jgi:SAM-dependent methyltransferase
VRALLRLPKTAAKKALGLFGYEISRRRLTPISPIFGFDRGRPIDRYYIDSFIARHEPDIKGHVLEAGGMINYTRRYGADRVTRWDILYPVEGHPDGTFVANLETGAGVPSDTFDCLILTQVYQFIFDVRSAIANSFRALRPGGVLLATLSGISRVSPYDLEHWGDYWRFTDFCAQRLFCDVFGPANVTIKAYGNVRAASAFLYGFAVEDLESDDLEFNDPNFPVAITVRAVKQPA